MTRDEVQERLRAAHREAPRLPAPDAALVERVRKVLQANPRAKESLSFGDLLLAEGCAKADAKALAELEAKVMPKVKQAIARVDASPQFVDEAVQQVRERLLSSKRGEDPRIRQYTGEGPLANWARVAAMRVALNLRRSQRGEEHAPEELVEPLGQASPELALMRAHLSEKLEAALSEALEQLVAEDRNLLRMHLVDGLSLDRLGKMLGVHKSTLSRRLQKLELTLMAETRAALVRRFGIRAAQLESALQVFSKPVQLSVRRLLGKADGG